MRTDCPLNMRCLGTALWKGVFPDEMNPGQDGGRIDSDVQRNKVHIDFKVVLTFC